MKRLTTEDFKRLTETEKSRIVFDQELGYFLPSVEELEKEKNTRVDNKVVE